MKIKMDDAKIVAEALKVEDPEWCKCYAEGDLIKIEIKTNKIGALLYAVDDYLMHLKLCEGILECIRKID
ncbi:MAG: KEOPS complex subunit Pcc1 [Archaeoglobaceae archaeon]|nr:KEOPS complex subunit Pcc1 [Archaeoglobaceae archaeon]MCX8152172.1 KEOPS complex subunit Pcc1 [Archaeoglobaceae archaeon]MDW8013888.1 KEOPS complex subunit Pcc1 [Archaeoglobaceae archaeon]